MGNFRQGSQNDERAAFESHADLMHHCRSGSSPRLFHKSSLQGSEEGALAAEVVNEIESPGFYDGPQGIQRFEPLSQRLHVDFQTDARFDNPRAVQIRLSAFDLDRLCTVGCKVRDIFCQHAKSADRISRLCDDAYIRDLADAVTGKLGGKVGIAPRISLKKLVADVLDRVDQFDDFNPREHYKLTIQESELRPIERQAMGATDIDEIELDL